MMLKMRSIYIRVWLVLGRAFDRTQCYHCDRTEYRNAEIVKMLNVALVGDGDIESLAQMRGFRIAKAMPGQFSNLYLY